ncbi:RluA family pseudouridine synthase [Paenibacillus sp. Leaf72]|uniref:RluA family pseudouridine synthase n=1 Tax=Paenibacillus sp. Leaf72 TaxID=1736234 RepID=UPI001F1C7A28|nr:RluA family pseudouridine synthase [Paenibacillus sp. Leaf72]
MNTDGIMDIDANYYKPLMVVVRAEDAGMSVRALVERRLGVSRSLLSRVKLTEHGITVNEQRVYTTATVVEGDIIRIRMEKETSEDILPEPIPLQIVFEDEHLLILNKPPGIVVHPTHGHYTGTLANGVVYHWRERGEKVRFRPVNRLDEDTSGLVVVAKSPYIHQQLSDQLQADAITKRYAAFVYGVPPERAGTINEPIDRDPDSPHVRIVTPDGYLSVTHYEIAAEYGDGAASLVRLRLETGRTHQIRVHMKYIGCPLIGDAMYGLPPEAGELCAAWEQAAGRQALHAEMLGLTHPMTGQWMEWRAELPEQLKLLKQLLEQKQESEPGAT